MMMCDKLHTQKKTAQKQREYTFYAHVLKVNINFQRKKKLFFLPNSLLIKE